MKCENCGTEDKGAPSWKPACLIERDALREALAASEARAQDIVDSLLSFGWTIADPWYTKRHDRNHIEVHDSGPICPVCGQAAPWDENWPLGFTMEDPANHDPECALIPYLTS